MNPTTINCPTCIAVDFLRKPTPVRWGYELGAQGQYTYDSQVYDPNITLGTQGSTNFELHTSEQTEAILKILMYAGVIIRDPEIVQAAAQHIGDGDGVTVQVQAQGCDDMRFGAIAYGGGQGLSSQHMGAVQSAVNDTVQQYPPVGLWFQGHVQPFILKESFFVGDGQWCHVSELDEPQGQVFLLWPAHIGGSAD